ncbi:hypothetical protein TNCV_1751691 [Trichonephila clavipes]|nr:hypothetical protein TNCV_1751691 [Trichonephila clavipes]
MITVYWCGGTLVSGTIPHTVLRHTAHTAGSPCGSAKTADAIVSSVHDLELAVQDLWAHLPHDNIELSNQLNAGPWGGVYCSWRLTTPY